MAQPLTKEELEALFTEFPELRPAAAPAVAPTSHLTRRTRASKSELDALRKKYPERFGADGNVTPADAASHVKVLPSTQVDARRDESKGELLQSDSLFSVGWFLMWAALLLWAAGWLFATRRQAKAEAAEKDRSLELYEAARASRAYEMAEYDRKWKEYLREVRFDPKPTETIEEQHLLEREVSRCHARVADLAKSAAESAKRLRDARRQEAASARNDHAAWRVTRESNSFALLALRLDALVVATWVGTAERDGGLLLLSHFVSSRTPEAGVPEIPLPAAVYDALLELIAATEKLEWQRYGLPRSSRLAMSAYEGALRERFEFVNGKRPVEVLRASFNLNSTLR
jgi:hypothetical protein